MKYEILIPIRIEYGLISIDHNHLNTDLNIDSELSLNKIKERFNNSYFDSSYEPIINYENSNKLYELYKKSSKNIMNSIINNNIQNIVKKSTPDKTNIICTHSGILRNFYSKHTGKINMYYYYCTIIGLDNNGKIFFGPKSFWNKKDINNIYLYLTLIIYAIIIYISLKSF